MTDDHFAACRRRHVWKDLFERLPFHVDVSSCVAHRHVQPRMTEPLTDSGDVNAGLEKVNGGRVSKRGGGGSSCPPEWALPWRPYRRISAADIERRTGSAARRGRSERPSGQPACRRVDGIVNLLIVWRASSKSVRRGYATTRSSAISRHAFIAPERSDR